MSEEPIPQQHFGHRIGETKNHQLKILPLPPSSHPLKDLSHGGTSIVAESMGFLGCYVLFPQQFSESATRLFWKIPKKTRCFVISPGVFSGFSLSWRHPGPCSWPGNIHTFQRGDISITVGATITKWIGFSVVGFVEKVKRCWNIFL